MNKFDRYQYSGCFRLFHCTLQIILNIVHTSICIGTIINTIHHILNQRPNIFLAHTGCHRYNVTWTLCQRHLANLELRQQCSRQQRKLEPNFHVELLEQFKKPIMNAMIAISIQDVLDFFIAHALQTPHFVSAAKYFLAHTGCHRYNATWTLCQRHLANLELRQQCSQQRRKLEPHFRVVLFRWPPDGL